MKKLVLSTLSVLFFALVSVSVNAQMSEKEINAYLKQVDKTILGIDKQFNTMTPQQRNLYKRMATGDRRAGKELERVSRARLSRMQAADRAYSQRYNSTWAQSFNTFNNR
jgi:hypothetical protein